MNALFDDRFINLPKPMNKIINWKDSVLFKRKINKLSKMVDQNGPQPFKFYMYSYYLIFSETNQTHRLRADSRKRCEWATRATRS